MTDASLQSSSPQTVPEEDIQELVDAWDEETGCESPEQPGHVSPRIKPVPPNAGIYSRHRTMLALSLSVIVLAPMLVVMENRELVALRWWPERALPESCLAKNWVEEGCPGCGLTRSTIYFFQGRLRDAWDMNRIGPLMVITILLQVPYRLWGLFGPNPYPLGKRGPWLFGWFLTVALLGNYIWLLIE